MLPLIHKFDAFHEFIFLAAIGWCLAVASGAKAIGLSLEIGAFVAGVSMATSPIAQYIAENLRPLRDFFLVMFFFSVGAASSLRPDRAGRGAHARARRAADRPETGRCFAG